VRLPGYIGENDKAALLSGAKALVFPSLYEGFGFPVLEAQACGTPVVCAGTSSLPEVAGDGALLIDPLDARAIAGALERIAREFTLREELVGRGYKNIRRFSWDSAAAQVLTTLENVTRPA
jgi:glycosyltransferase involved in cell wall biosynthesis